MQHDHVTKKNDFWPFDPNQRVRNAGWGLGSVGVWRQNICFHTAAFRDSLQLDMQHDHVLKKLKFDILTPSPGSVREGVGFCGQNIYYHCAAFVILYLICNRPCSEKVEFWPFDPIPRVRRLWGGGGSAGKIFATILLHSWFSLIWYALWNVLKKLNFNLLIPSPKATQGVRHRHSIENHGWYVSYLLYLCLNAKFQ